MHNSMQFLYKQVNDGAIPVATFLRSLGGAAGFHQQDVLGFVFLSACRTSLLLICWKTNWLAVVSIANVCVVLILYSVWFS
jgi:hypothetical protein